MPVLSIEYDLHEEPGRVYNELIKAIKEFPWCRKTKSSWLIRTSLTPDDVRDHLKPHLHRGDKLFVMRVKTPAVWSSMNLPDDVVRWLHKHLQTSPTPI